MAGKQATGDVVPPSVAGMSKSQLYDIMCQVKALIEQNRQQARQILIQNPLLTRALFQAQIMLGMVQPPQAVSTISPSASQNSQLAIMPSGQSNVQASLEISGQIGQNQVRKLQSSQSTTSKPQTHSIPPPNPQLQSLPSQPLTSIQPPKGHLGPQPTPLSITQPSQVPNLPLGPPPPSSLHQIPLSIPSLPAQLQPPLQNTGSQYLAPQQPLSAQPRPQMPAFPHQGHGQMGPNLGFQYPGGQQLHHSQTMFHSAAGASGNLGPSFLLPLPNQPLPPSVYQAGGPPSGMEFNQTDRGSSFFGAGHNQPPRPPTLTPDMEKALLQQVMSLSPEQMSMLPTDQRNQILQLQQFFRQ